MSTCRVNQLNPKSIEIYKNQENLAVPKPTSSFTQSGNKLLTFIKIHPFYFSLILIGVCVLIAIAIAIPIIVVNKDKNSENNLENTDDDANNEILILNEEKKEAVTLIYNDIGNNDKGSLEQFCNYLNEKSGNLDDNQKVYLTYYWVANNIKYDAYKFLNNMSPDCEPSSFFETRLTVCSGYARLFAHLLKCMNYPENSIKNIVGYAKGYGFNRDKSVPPGHEWNAVYLNEKWCLIDTTWGAGSLSGNSFVAKYTEYYLCIPGERLIRTHYPQESQKDFQLIEPKLSLDEFKFLVDTQPSFFELGFTKIIEDNAIQNVCGPGKITLKYNTSIRPILFLYFIKKGDGIEEYIFLNKRIEQGYELNFYINQIGTYNLYISANTDGNNVYNNILELTIDCKDDGLIVENYYPLFYREYEIIDNIELIKPLDGKLKKGSTYDFEIKLPEDDAKLYVSVAAIEYEMERNGDIFTKINFPITSDHVQIIYKNTAKNKDTSIIVYKTFE